MADDGKLTAELDGLRRVSREIVTLGDATDAAASTSTSSVLPNAFSAAGLAGFAVQRPLSQVPATIATASHTLAGRFFVLGDLMTTAADELGGADERIAAAIASAGDLNQPAGGGR